MKIKNTRDSITVKDYLKYQQLSANDKSIWPNIKPRYSHGYWNVFMYDQLFEEWLKKNEIDYRINYESIIVTRKPYKE